MRTVERRIPVLIAGPCDEQAIAPDEALHAVIARRYDDPDSDAATEIVRLLTAEYVRRTYQVGGVAAHGWVWRDLDDREAAEAMWTWLLDAAGVLEDDREEAIT